MKINTDSFYMVMQPYPEIENFDELFRDIKRNLADLEDLFSGGITASNIYGLYTDIESALNDANKLWKKVLKEKEENIMKESEDVRFREFVAGLERLSNVHNIAIESIGGVYIFDAPKTITYDEDHTSGDLIARWEDD